MWSEVRDGVQAYEISRSFSKTVLRETLIASILIGLCTHSLSLGVVAFVAITLLWGFPFIGTFMMIAFSAVYAFIAYQILSLICIPSAICIGVCILVFVSYLGKHIMTVGD